MRIAYFINTFNSINWGGQATSNAIKYMLGRAYPNAEFVAMNMPELPFKKMKLFRQYYDQKLIAAILHDEIDNIYKYLSKMNVPPTIFDGYTHVCFNGEGAVHARSGHLSIFMGLLYIAKHQGKKVAAVNQTIDLAGNQELEALLKKVYTHLDFVSVREPLSLQYAKGIGIKDIVMIPDATYGLPRLKEKEIDKRLQKFHLPEAYIGITGSSILKRNARSLQQMRSLLTYVRKHFEQPIVFLANAKTDIWLAHRLKNEFAFEIIEPPVKYLDAIAIISRAFLIIGGRQHPNIFAYIYGVPYLPYKGNTFKNDGVALLQEYPVMPLEWSSDERQFTEALHRIEHFVPSKKIMIDDFRIFPEKTGATEQTKRVAVVVTNLAGSGAEKVALAQAKLFKEQGHDVVMFLIDNVMTYCTEGCRFPIIPLTRAKNTYKFMGDIGNKVYARILEKKMKEIGTFDLVISNLPRADKAVKHLKHPNKYFVIHTSYKTELEKLKRTRANRKRKQFRQLYEDEKIITVAKAIIEGFDALKINYKEARTVYNPFDFEKIRSLGSESIGLQEEYIISASAFRKVKRYDVLLDAFAKVPQNIKLVILANSDPKLQQMIKKRGLENRVIILGFQQNPYKYIKHAKLLVLSSEREGLPTVLIESLILGTPVVSTDCPTGPSEILTGNLSRWLVPVNDANALAEKIDEALKSDIFIDESVLKKFSKETVYEQFKSLL
jgi:glycosyltransferase involved in cell wall biosynthesis/polysaccharide pyruvyl transferase WcaK-like protein